LNIGGQPTLPSFYLVGDKMKIEVNSCSRCDRKDTARWYYKLTSSPICCSCYRKEYVANNREKALEAQRKANQSDKSKQARKDYAQTKAGRTSKRKYDRKHSKENPEKMKLKRKELKGYYSDYAARRKRRLEEASLQGLGRSETVAIYQNCPEGYHVDHIVPRKAHAMIDGKRTYVACGLHVFWNLQYLTATENLKKGSNLYSLSDLD